MFRAWRERKQQKRLLRLLKNPMRCAFCGQSHPPIATWLHQLHGDCALPDVGDRFIRLFIMYEMGIPIPDEIWRPILLDIDWDGLEADGKVMLAAILMQVGGIESLGEEHIELTNSIEAEQDRVINRINARMAKRKSKSKSDPVKNPNGDIPPSDEATNPPSWERWDNEHTTPDDDDL